MKTATPPQAPGRLLDTAAAAIRLDLSKRTLQTLVARREVDFIRIGKSIRFAEADLDRFIESRRVMAVGWKEASR